MRPYQALLKKFLSQRAYDYRMEQQYSQERMAEVLHIAPRSYLDLEHGKYGFSALTFIFFLLALPENEVIKLLQDFRELTERSDHNDAA